MKRLLLALLLFSLPAFPQSAPTPLAPLNSTGAATGCNNTSIQCTYTDTAVPPGQHFYFVVAQNANGYGIVSNSVNVTVPSGTSYFLSPTGNDANNGLTIGTPWLSPNHAINCGDTITAAASASYSAANFQSFGIVSCPTGTSVAWLTCATFDACKITATGTSNGMEVNHSYWGVQGWEVTAISTVNDTAACFVAYPSGGSEIHHIIFANDIANQCSQNGFGSANNGLASVDYLSIIGNIVYKAAQTNVECNSGISVYQPQTSDLLAGTHIYLAGNFLFDAQTQSATCNGGAPTDLAGVNIDDPDGTQTSGLTPYAGQIAVENNISVFNGGQGIEIGNSNSATTYFEYNTVYGNSQSTHRLTGTYCGEVSVISTQNAKVIRNISDPTVSTFCNGNPLYAYYIGNAPTTGDVVSQDVAFSPSAQYASSDTGFSFGPSNLFGTNPSFSNPTNPGAPSCGSATSVPNCMASVVSHFTPTASGVSAYGYQVPLSTPQADPLFPQWLCSVNLPSGLVTSGCVNGNLGFHNAVITWNPSTTVSPTVTYFVWRGAPPTNLQVIGVQ